MNKIKHVSLLFRVLVLIIFVMIPLLEAIFWLQAPTPITLGNGLSGSGIAVSFIPKAIQILHPMTQIDRMNGFLITLIPTSMILLICFYLMSLFKLYQKGVIFSLDNVKLIKKIGLILVVGQLVQPFYQFLLSMALTWDNPIHHRYGFISMNQTNLGFLLIGLILILISWIMAEGHKLQEEQEFTV